MTIKQIEYFMAVAKSLNFSDAAKQLYVSQPGLSRSIAALENEIGVKLFERNKHYVSLTPAGLLLFDAIPKISTNFSHAIIEAQQISQGQSGKLVFGILDGLPMLPPLQSTIDFFRCHRQDIDICPVCLNIEECSKAIHDGDIDILYSYDTNDIFDTSLSRVNLAIDRFAVAVSRASKYADYSQLHLKDLEHEKIFFSGSETSYELHRWKELCAEVGFFPRITSVLNPSSQMFCIEQNFGVSLLPTTHRLMNGRYIKAIPLVEVFPLTLDLKWKRNHENPAVTLFIDIVNDALSGESSV